MAAIIVSGRAIREVILEELKPELECLSIGRALKLSVLQLFPQVPDEVYTSSLRRVAEKLGFQVEVINHETKDDLVNSIMMGNEDEGVDGIMIQTPEKADYLYFTSLIVPEKDVDGASPMNLGRLIRKDKGLRPATADAVIRIIKETGFDVKGKNACIVGRSFRSGLPIAIMLMNEDATCTICHSHTKDISIYTREADILVAAVGKPGLITGRMVKEGAFVVDVGINEVDGKIVGDVLFEEVAERSSFITPVPGGVGSVTDIMIFRNLIKGVRMRYEK